MYRERSTQTKSLMNNDQPVDRAEEVNKQAVVNVIEQVLLISIWRHQEGEGFAAVIAATRQRELLPQIMVLVEMFVHVDKRY